MAFRGTERAAIALIGLAGWLCACVDAAGPPPTAVPFATPARYRGWWKLMEACSGLTGDFDAIRWYVIPNRGSFQLGSEPVAGVYYSYGNQIVLADSVKHMGAIVRHEMLHALMPNVGGHPRHQFLDRCGDIVACIGPCVTDAGGPPDWSTEAPLVPATSLTVGVLVPSTMSWNADSGWLPITVTVTNHAPHPVRVATPPIIPAGDAATHISEAFKYVLTPQASRLGDSVPNYSYAIEILLASAGTAGSTRRVVFDLFPPFFRREVGDYDVTGLFLDGGSRALVRAEP